MKAALRKLATDVLLPLSLLAGVHTLLVAGVAYGLDVHLSFRAQATDLALALLVGVPLLMMSRNRVAWLAMMTLLLALLHVGNALKITMLGGPVLPDDFFAAQALFFIMKTWQAVLGGAILALLLVFLVLSVGIRPLRARIGAALLATLAALIALVPAERTVASLDRTYGNVVWNQRGNYESRGPLLYLLQEGSRARATRPHVPVAAEVRTAFEALVGTAETAPAPASAASAPTVAAPAGSAGTPTAAENPARRTLVVILLESFFDPSSLKAARFSRDPLHPDFRALWKKTGYSHGLSPVFGGYTANAEFEVLCGFPVTMDAVFFEKGLTRDVPCLPRLLAGAGYTTIASHPNIPVFWNRVNAYRRIGFDVYRARDDFDLDDMNGEYLADSSLYRQVLDHVGPMIDAKRPTFSYVVTFFGHLDYPLNENREQPVRARNGDELLERYANTVHDKSRALMEFIRDVQKRDPDALIVAFGDHLPFLGPNFGGYTESGLLESSRSDFTDSMFRTVSATPLIVIDGKKGPLVLGDMPLYRLPSLIRSLMGNTDLSLVDITSRAPGETRIRPLPGMAYGLTPPKRRNGKPALTVCRFDDTDPEACAAQKEWLQAVETLTRDVFSGRQETLGLLPSPDLSPEKLVTEANTPQTAEEL
ncbi:LTA synthase family protein [Phaeovibrio sulfidiphilus]|uniref:LTA synthase family protein n=1 Tax=Phaeovibrio sulfidiphilus TaxID=1220600 RepID=A0A8J6YLL4_9PROT|nr:LTA synthase family protein [Phaeovibrio sulfidiphilus]MBE1236838.1 LTA synthase family protein [Phaeovibrio sulfidiphilus]